jgi:hypothetical protein
MNRIRPSRQLFNISLLYLVFLSRRSQFKFVMAEAPASSRENGSSEPTTIALHDLSGQSRNRLIFPGNTETGYRDDDASLNSAFTEATTVPRRNLGFIQCSALMINQMIGTGIFTLPGLVLLLAKSKPIAITLWAVGGIYSLLRFVHRICFRTVFMWKY